MLSDNHDVAITLSKGIICLDDTINYLLVHFYSDFPTKKSRFINIAGMTLIPLSQLAIILLVLVVKFIACLLRQNSRKRIIRKVIKGMRFLCHHVLHKALEKKNTLKIIIIKWYNIYICNRRAYLIILLEAIIYIKRIYQT